CTFLLCFLKADTSYMYLIIIYAIRMFAVSLLMMPINTAGINALENKNISHGTAIMNFGRVMAGSLGTALMVTFMSMGSKWLGSTIATSGSKEMIQRQTVAAGVDVSFALVTLFVVVAFSFALFIKEPRNKNKNIREV
ncbi:MAG: MFS transporter, partial [Staphylococcus sp.]|nr:MFS transporter [Staphylococcus sp.]